MKIDDIEYKTACGDMTAAEVFTQMKQHIQVKDQEIQVLQAKLFEKRDLVRP